MTKALTKIAMMAAGLAALALGGSALAGAASSSTPSTSTTPGSGTPSPGSRAGAGRGPGFTAGDAPGTPAHEDAEKAVTGEAAEKAKAAAAKSVPGKAGAVTTDLRGGGYEVEVTRSDGTKVTVHLDSSFTVTMGPGGHGHGFSGGPPPAGAAPRSGSWPPAGANPPSGSAQQAGPAPGQESSVA